MSTDQPITSAENFHGATVPDGLAYTTLSALQEAGIGKVTIPHAGEQQARNYPLPPVELMCSADPSAAAGETSRAAAAKPDAKAPGPEVPTRFQPAAGDGASAEQSKDSEKTKGSEKTKANDQTKAPGSEPVKMSPLAEEMHRRKEAAEHNAKARKQGQAIVDQPSSPGDHPGHPADQPPAAKPVDGGRFKYDQSNYKEAEKKAAAEGKRLVYHFGASWCGACQQMNRESWHNKDQRVDGAIKNNNAILVDVDIDKAPAELKQQFNVTSLPTTILAKPVKGGAAPQEITREGYMGETALVDWLSRRLK